MRFESDHGHVTTSLLKSSVPFGSNGWLVSAVVFHLVDTVMSLLAQCYPITVEAWALLLSLFICQGKNGLDQLGL
jgi:hypothetical protein